MTEPILLSARNAMVKARGKTLIGPIDLELGPGGVTVVIGPNGAGKTTLLKTLYGIQRPSAGEVTWPGGEEDIRKRQAFVFQSPVMLRRSVRDNIAYPLRLDGINRKTARDRAEDWGHRVGLGRVLTAPARQLSGGERQKLAVARALINGPRVLFLDEPCAFLDGRATREIEEILKSAVNDGTRLIMSTHDLGQAKRMATEIAFVLGGQICEFRPATDFFAAPDTGAATAFLRGDIVE